jgi:hypothetical protein
LITTLGEERDTHTHTGRARFHERGHLAYARSGRELGCHGSAPGLDGNLGGSNAAGGTVAIPIDGPGNRLPGEGKTNTLSRLGHLRVAGVGGTDGKVDAREQHTHTAAANARSPFSSQERKPHTQTKGSQHTNPEDWKSASSFDGGVQCVPDNP